MSVLCQFYSLCKKFAKDDWDNPEQEEAPEKKAGDAGERGSPADEPCRRRLRQPARHTESVESVEMLQLHTSRVAISY